jgi:hypothetical protein
MKFGKLLVINHGIKRPNNYHRYFECQCDCGNTIEIRGSHLLEGAVTSCKCGRGEHLRTHGLSKVPEYRIWAMMIQRCTNPKELNYQYYGAKGIKVCKRWLKFENFYEDMGTRPSLRHTIDRKNGAKGYYKYNCRWVTKSVQSKNRGKLVRSKIQLTAFGVTATLAVLARTHGQILNTVKSRLIRGMSLEEALTKCSR